MRACRFLSALLVAAILSGGCAAAPSSTAPSPGKPPKLVCTSIDAPVEIPPPKQNAYARQEIRWLMPP